MIKATNISYHIGNKILVNNVSFTIHPNEFVVIMGPNGAGKSTLLKMLAGSLSPSKGEIAINNKLLEEYSSQQLAIKRAVLSQHYHIAFPSTAKDIVMMGRYPYYKNNPSPKDEAMVQQAMQQMQVEIFVERDYNTLSGGEAQKVQMSRVLAQIGEATANNKKLLFLDEPVSNLDIKYQHQLLKVAKELCKTNTSVVAVLHDINLAIKYADRILFMKQGAICNAINNTKTITAAIIKDVFDVDAKMMYDESGMPVVVF